jgi:protein-disulfide isomerase
MIPTRHRWLLCSPVLAALVITVLTGPPAHAGGCAPVNESRVRDAVRAYLKVPADMPFELVASHPVGTSCYTRLLFETVDPNQIRESTIYLSPDRLYLSRDLYGLEEGDGSTAPPQSEAWMEVSADQPALGAAQPKVTVVEFSDFQCPYCRGASTLLGQLAESDPNVRVVFRHMPLPNHPWALPAARAASCLRGDDFWKLHDYYFEKQRELNPENIAAKSRELVGTLGTIDMAAFDQCVGGNASLDAVRRDVRAAALLGVNGTPTLYANGKRLRPAATMDALRKEIATATGFTVRGPAETTTYMVFMRPTGRSSSPEIDKNAATFRAQLKKEGSLVSAGHAEGTDGAAGFEILTIRANNTAAAMQLISQSPDIAGGVVKAEVVEYQPTEIIVR